MRFFKKTVIIKRNGKIYKKRRDTENIKFSYKSRNNLIEGFPIGNTGYRILKGNLQRIPEHLRKRLDHVLDNGFTVTQAWIGLSKAWLAFRVVKAHEDLDKMLYYADVILKLEGLLELPLANFSYLEIWRRYDRKDRVFMDYDSNPTTKALKEKVFQQAKGTIEQNRYWTGMYSDNYIDHNYQKRKKKMFINDIHQDYYNFHNLMERDSTTIRR